MTLVVVYCTLEILGRLLPQVTSGAKCTEAGGKVCKGMFGSNKELIVTQQSLNNRCVTAQTIIGASER